MLNGIEWIAADWGTTNLRVWAIGIDGRIVAEASSGDGMAKLERAGFEPALTRLIGSWLPKTGAIPVIACGMVGARQGWIEVPYRQAPCRPFSHEQIGIPDVGDNRLKVRVLPGIKQIAYIIDIADAPAHGQGHEHAFGGLTHHVQKYLTALMAGRNVQKNQFVRTRLNQGRWNAGKVVQERRGKR